MNLRTMALIAIAVWTPIVGGQADGAPRLKRDLQRPAAKCLSQQQILAKLRKQGYRASRKDIRKSSGQYIVTAVRHSSKLDVKVDRCTGKILGVQAARAAAARRDGKFDHLRKRPKIRLTCMSKQAIHQKLKARGYNYLKLENIHGPFNTPKGKVYRAQTLVKEGPRWCQAKLTASCYNGQVTDYDTLEDTCIY